MITPPKNIAFTRPVPRTDVRESRTLAALRDTLLPKLISSELRVTASERIRGEAVA